MIRFGLIDQNYPKITWLGTYSPNLSSQKYPNEFYYGYKSYKIDENGFWQLYPDTTCYGDPKIINGKLHGFIISKNITFSGDGELSKKMANYVLDNDSTEENQKVKQICRYYERGLCTKGKNCEFKHIGHIPQKILCKFYPLGKCKKGDDCPFLH